MKIKLFIIISIISLGLGFFIGYKVSSNSYKDTDVEVLTEKLDNIKCRLENAKKQIKILETTIDEQGNIVSELKEKNKQMNDLNNEIKTLYDNFSEKYTNLENSANDVMELISIMKDNQIIIKDYISKMKYLLKEYGVKE